MRNSLALIKRVFPTLSSNRQGSSVAQLKVPVTGQMHNRAGTHNGVNNAIWSFTNEVNHSIGLSIKHSSVLPHQTEVSMGTESL